MQYRSTRGGSVGKTFEDAVLEGLAPDGGLYIPHSIPAVSLPQLVEWSRLPFAQLAAKILRLFIAESEIPDADLTDLCERSYASFSHPLVTPTVPLPNVAPNASPADHNLDNLHVLELFHGPTFAFKDVALQFVGNLFEYFLARRNRADPPKDGEREKHWITVLGATSGDTGGAAIYGLRGKRNVSVFILHPKGRISPVQEQQMTSVLDENVFNVAVEGSFDDCQDIVKTLFGDRDFRTKYRLAAINSINWARILAQTTYYFYSYFAVLRHHNVPFESAPSYAALTKIQYSVPTGNFGDILAGYFALRMGLPIHKLIIATNENDILHRFMETGVYNKLEESTIPLAATNGHANGHANGNGTAPADNVRQTLSPAMDILVSSNFERLAWYLARGDGRKANLSATAADEEAASQTVLQWMTDLKSAIGGFSVTTDVLALAREVFASIAVSDAQTSDAIKRYYHHQFLTAHDAQPVSSLKPTSYVLDPHTAVGVVAAETLLGREHEARLSSRSPGGGDAVHTVILATASPGKFPEAVMEAINEGVPAWSVQSGFEKIKYEDFAPKGLVALQGLPKRCIDVTTNGGKKELGVEGVRKVVEEKVQGL